MAPCKGIQDSFGFWVPGFGNPDSLALGNLNPIFLRSTPYALMPLPVQLILRELGVASQKDRTSRFLTGAFRILSGFT